jgi:glycosyltransferase involved in cell wall biosynthesis
MEERQPFFSIVIPIYNTEQYILKCLQTIQNQKNFNDFEVLLVNDGSTDSSVDICEQFLSCDNRFRYYEKENGGLSSSRNYGMERAIGKYLLFVDSDDYVSLDMLSTLYAEIVKYDEPDIVEFLLSRVINGKVAYESSHNKEPNAFNIISCKSNSSACIKAFKSSFFVESKVLFPDGWLYEDVASIYKLYLQTSNIISVDKSLYFYNQRAGSITSDLNIEHINALFNIARSTREFLKSKNLHEVYSQAIHLRFISVAFICFKGLWGKNKSKELLPIVVEKLCSEYGHSESINLLKDYNVFTLESYVENIYLWEEKLSAEMKKREVLENNYESISNLTLSRNINSLLSFTKGLKEKYKRIAIYGNGNISRLIKPILAENTSRVYDISSPLEFVNDNELIDKPVHPSLMNENDFDAIFITILGREREIIDFLIHEKGVEASKVVTYKCY